MVQAADAAFGGSPERAVAADTKIIHSPSGQSVCRRVRGADLTVLQETDSAAIKSEPKPTHHGIGDQGICEICGPEARRWDVIDDMLTFETKQSFGFVCEPNPALGVACDRSHFSARCAADGSKSA
ncbi:MAG TPA: hypothetical protein VGX46_16965, partial [Vicinamibacterales bacterium]|nr:hypothetical protein [Vicinamibacterales bacterium]